MSSPCISDGVVALSEAWRLFAYLARFEALRIPQELALFRCAVGGCGVLLCDPYQT